VPPVRGTVQRSPAKLKQISLALSAGSRNNKGARSCAGALEGMTKVDIRMQAAEMRMRAVPRMDR
jgi:hypothetical protein